MPHRLSLAALGLVVFAANAGLLVLQLVAGRVLAPFVGSSLETWTAVIGIFLAGIAAGNWIGAGDRFAIVGRRTLAGVLLIGAVSTVWPIAFAEILQRTGLHASLPLGVRIFVLVSITCFPAGFTLALLTPLAVRLGTADVRSAGRVAGMTFAFGTLGCLVGNYATGFWLIPTFTINTIIFGVAGMLALLAAIALVLPIPNVRSTERNLVPRLPPMGRSFAVVFACSFAGMTLELAGVRAMAQIVGVSLFTWTGVIGVMLAGTAAGNWLGGILADHANRRGIESAKIALATCLIVAGTAVTTILGVFIASQSDWFSSWPIVLRVVAWSFALFFFPMTMLGTISPQVVRLATVDARSAGPIAGRIYAMSTIGAIVGTFATGYILLAEVGMLRLILAMAILPLAAAFLIARVWEKKALLYVVSIVGGIVAGGVFLYSPETTKIAKETNYFTIQVNPAKERTLAAHGVLTLTLDRLIHSWVMPDDPTFLYYAHERIQLAILREQAERIPKPRVLVIGGGGYTFPRAARTIVPTCIMDVVEIDPGVTQVSYERLFLDPKLDIHSFHMDGRQFVSEIALPSSYHLIVMDAVNDLSVPSHLLTKEFNDSVRTVLAPGGTYLVSVIDQPDIGKVLPAVIHTLRKTFPHVELLNPNETWDAKKQVVFAIYASDKPYDAERLLRHGELTVRDPRIAIGGGPMVAAIPWNVLNRPPSETLNALLSAEPPLVLTDQYAPIDWLMAEVFRRRQREGK